MAAGAINVRAITPRLGRKDCDVRHALEASGVPASQHEAYVTALRGLAATDMIRKRAGEAAA